MLFRRLPRLLCVMLILFSTQSSAQTPNKVLEIDDPLTGKSGGILNGGMLTAEGWKTAASFDYIQYNIPTCAHGEIEFEVRGLYASNQVFPNLAFDNNGRVVADAVNVHYTLFAMFDRDDDNSWFGVTQWHNPYKCLMHLFGYTPGDLYKWRYMKLRLNVAAFNGGYDDDPHAFEDPAVGPFDWQKDHVYHHRLIWGDGLMSWYMDGQLVREWDYSAFGEEYAPPDHSIRLGSGFGGRCGGFQAPIGIVYKNFKFYRHTDVTPPLVLSAEPVPQVDGVALDADILVVFSEPMDAASTETAFSIQPSVAGSYKWIGNALYLQRSALLRENTTYTVRISTAAKDRAGQNLAQPFEHTFTTRSAVVSLVRQYEPFEVTLTVPGLGNRNRYRDVWLKGVFRGPTKTVEIEGFWDGDDIWKVRMAPTETGVWNYEVTGSEAALQARGSFTCIAGSSRGFIRPNPARPHSFMYDDGTPWLWKGDTAWRGYTALIPYDSRWKSYIDLRAQQGYTAMQSIVVSYINGLGFWKNEGGTCFAEGSDAKDYDRLNPKYFHWIDKRLDYALSKGIVPVILFTWAQEYVKFSEAQFEKYARYLVARFAAKNVIWVLCGEYNEIPTDFNRSTAEFSDWGSLVKKYDPYDHPITLHPTGRTSCGEFGYEKWLDVIMQQTPYYVRDVVRDRTYGKPVVNGEPRYFYPVDYGGGPNDESRMALWEIVTAGGYYTSGFFTTFAPDKGGWDPAALNEEQQWVAFLNKFLDRLPLTEMDPHNEWTSKGQLLANPGVEYLAYSRNGGDVTIDLTHTSRSLPAEWLNPRAGTIHDAGVVTGGAARTLSPPFAGDWALHIGSGVKADTIPPNPPMALTSPNQTMNSIALSWQPPTAAEDGDIAGHYLVVRQGIALSTVQATSYNDTGLEESFTYTYEVFAVDDAGLKSLQPATLTVSTRGDNQPPVATELKVISTTELQLLFNEKVEQASAENIAHYVITPEVRIISASLASEGTVVTIKTELQKTGGVYSLQVNHIKDRARNANIMSAPQTFEYTIEAKLNISELSPASYQVANLTVNSKYYVDRDYVLQQIPEACRGFQWIMTENDDKTRSDAHWLSFKVNVSAIVMVAFDSTMPLPAWLQSWQNTGEKIITSDDAPLQLYRKLFPSGQVVLGANEGTNKSSMYVVLANKSDTPVIDNMAPHVPLGFRFGE